MALEQWLAGKRFVKPAYAVVAAWLFAESMQQRGVFPRVLATVGMAAIVSGLLLQPDIGQTELQLIMNYLTDAELPAYGALTREFAICDRWFCSHIGGTLPNRFISLTGDLSEDIYGSPEAENPDLANGFAPLEA